MCVFRGQVQRAAHVVAFIALAAGGAAAPAAEPMVVVISVDGLANFYFGDPKAEMPTIRRLAAQGARAPMKASLPSVTWPNHTTLVTGVEPARHGVVGNNFFDRAARRVIPLIADPILDKSEAVRVPTVYDLAKERGFTTASVRWPATRNAPTLDWTIPDVHKANLMHQYTTPEVLSWAGEEGLEIERAASPDNELTGKYRSRDELWTAAFLQILERHRPNLALLHIADVDHVEHADGPRSREAYAAIAQADEQVRLVWEAIERLSPGRATAFVVSDHGFSPIRRTILPNVLLRQAGLWKLDGDDPTGSVATIIQGGACFVYVLDESRREQILAAVRQTFADVPGLRRIVGVDEFAEFGLADPKVDPRAPDLALLAEMGLVFGDTASGELPFDEKPERSGSHGHDPNLPDLQATFVACGAGIRSGVELELISNTSVAPTVARILGFEMPDVDGAALEAALDLQVGSPVGAAP